MQALFVLLCTKLTILLQQAMEILVYIIVLHLHLHLYVCLHQKEGDKEIPLMLHAIPINTIHHHILQVITCSLYCLICSMRHKCSTAPAMPPKNEHHLFVPGVLNILSLVMLKHACCHHLALNLEVLRHPMHMTRFRHWQDEFVLD